MTRSLPDRDRALLLHELAAIADRTRKALRDAPENTILAGVCVDRLQTDRPEPARPDADWPERPA